MLDGAQHYVIKTGTREISYRISDLAFSLERLDGAVVLRDVPSRLHYSWPLTVGKTWEQDYKRERPVDRQTFNLSTVWAIEADEIVTVPAGTFKALKITSKNKNTGALIYEMWYAPDVKQWVKIREVLSNGIRERELISFKLKSSAHLREVRPGFIPLETTEPKYQEYFNTIRERIKANWIYPSEAGSWGIEGDLNIEFVITKDGHLQFIELRRSSGRLILDHAALNAVKLAQPFPPVPDDLAKQALAINGLFVYRIREDAASRVNRFRCMGACVDAPERMP